MREFGITIFTPLPGENKVHLTGMCREDSKKQFHVQPIVAALKSPSLQEPQVYQYILAYWPSVKGFPTDREPSATISFVREKG